MKNCYPFHTKKSSEMIKPKTGQCPSCNDGKDKPLIAGYCQYHYWQSKRKPIQLKRPKPIRKISKKLSKEQRIYSGKRLIFLSENRFCQAKIDGCTHLSTEVHHKGKRGKNLNNVDTWMAVCRSCHDKIETMGIDDAVLKGFRIRINSA